MIRQIRSSRRLMFGLVGGILALLIAGGALAFFIASSTGTGTLASAPAVQAAPPPVALTITATEAGVQKPNPPGGPDTVWAFGDTDAVTLTLHNATANPATVTGVTIGSWSSDKANCSSANGTPAGALAGTFTLALATGTTLPMQVPANGTATVPVVITMNNLATVDQTACAGAHITFTFSSN